MITLEDLLFLLLFSGLSLVPTCAQADPAAGIWRDGSEANVLQSLQQPVVLLLDPSSSDATNGCPGCLKLDQFWNLAANFYGANRVFRGSCIDASQWCSERGLMSHETKNEPILLSWKTNTNTWEAYSGPHELQSLKDWMDQKLKQVNYNDNAGSSGDRMGQAGVEVQHKGPDSTTYSGVDQAQVHPHTQGRRDGHQQLSFSEFQRQQSIHNQKPMGNESPRSRPEMNPIVAGMLHNYNPTLPVPHWWPEDETLWDRFAMNPLHAAAFAGDLQYIQELLEKAERLGGSPAREQIQHFLDRRSRTGVTHVMLAVQAGHIDVVRLLVNEYKASVNIADAQGATPLRAAVLLGNTDMVKELLNLGAKIAEHDYHTLPLPQVARQRGHNETIAELLETSFPFQAKAFGEYLHNLHNSEELPPGATQKICPHPVNIEAARCDLVQCNGPMPVIDASTMKTDLGFPAVFRPLGDMMRYVVKEQLARERRTWKCRQAPYFHSTDHLPPDVAPMCHVGDSRCTLPLNWASGCPPNVDNDVWSCLFGQGEGADTLREPCACSSNKSNDTVFTDRDVSLLLHAAILLDGNRTSPNLTPGPTLPAHSSSETAIHAFPPGSSSRKANNTDVTAISVHVRAGDSCDVMTWGADLGPWALMPFNWTVASATDWTRVQRFCIHPSVHLATVWGILATHKSVKTILLASDSPLAVEVFQEHLSERAPHIALEVNTYDRSALDHATFVDSTGDPLTGPAHWIENRARDDPQFASHSMHTALEDVRLLSRGNLLIAGMCSHFAKMAYATMVAHNGREIPVISLDKCHIDCDPNKLKYFHGQDLEDMAPS